MTPKTSNIKSPRKFSKLALLPSPRWETQTLIQMVRTSSSRWTDWRSINFPHPKKHMGHLPWTHFFVFFFQMKVRVLSSTKKFHKKHAEISRSFHESCYEKGWEQRIWDTNDCKRWFYDPYDWKKAGHTPSEWRLQEIDLDVKVYRKAMHSTTILVSFLVPWKKKHSHLPIIPEWMTNVRDQVMEVPFLVA